MCRRRFREAAQTMHWVPSLFKYNFRSIQSIFVKFTDNVPR